MTHHPAQRDDDRPISRSMGREEIDPPRSIDIDDDAAVPAESGLQLAAQSPEVQRAVDALIERVNGGPARPSDQRLVREMITAVLKLIPDGRDTGELKLLTAATKELRYAFRVFGQYPDPHKVSIFGSARTPPEHPDYLAAVEMGRLMADAGWMVITGAGAGIMQAGHVGPGRKSSFGVAIRLPFEQVTNEIISGDEKLINFRYFFTRKVMFLSQSEAVVCFPGGFGTLDEAFETLTLIQTGKAPMIPIVLVEGQDPSGRPGYWDRFEAFIRGELLDRGWISPEDMSLMFRAATPRAAADHILAFYRNYCSCRYVRDELVIRLRRPLTPESIDTLNTEFARLIARGRIRAVDAFDAETVARDLPRIAFAHTRRDFGVVRRLIDRINELPTLGEPA